MVMVMMVECGCGHFGSRVLGQLVLKLRTVTMKDIFKCEEVYKCEDIL